MLRSRIVVRCQVPGSCWGHDGLRRDGMLVPTTTKPSSRRQLRYLWAALMIGGRGAVVGVIQRCWWLTS
jgi:hypothetical protein